MDLQHQPVKATWTSYYPSKLQSYPIVPVVFTKITDIIRVSICYTYGRWWHRLVLAVFILAGSRSELKDRCLRLDDRKSLAKRVNNSIRLCAFMSVFDQHTSVAASTVSCAWLDRLTYIIAPRYLSMEAYQ